MNVPELDLDPPATVNTAAYGYEWAKARMARARDPEAGKPLCNNTRLFKRGDNYAVRFHETDVVTITPDSEFIYDSGGRLTMSTKDRMNSFGPANIFSHRGHWYVQPFETEHRWDHRHAALFFDGIIVNAQGVVLNPRDPEHEANLLRRQEQADKQIVAYVQGYLGSLRDGMPMPGGGDCWYCSMFHAIPAVTRDARAEFSDGQRNAPAEEDITHLWDHVRERYFVPSLVFNALRDAGYTDYALAVYLGIREQGQETIGGSLMSHNGQQVIKRALLRYLRRRLLKGRAVR